VVTAHRDKIANYIQMGGRRRELVVDGRGFKLQGYENGFFIGPSLFDNVKPDMKTYQEEIFGPVLQIVRANTFEEAVACRASTSTATASPSSPATAAPRASSPRKVNVGMVGINVPIPVPVAYHTFGGWKRSAFGDTNQHGPEGLKFWTKTKTVTARWPEGDEGDSSFVIPTMR
jgi:malonate-semialdehyde dehydrogenase (acetylating)/methylmalonate-semialdehyde dehydrogenase